MLSFGDMDISDVNTVLPLGGVCWSKFKTTVSVGLIQKLALNPAHKSSEPATRLGSLLEIPPGQHGYWPGGV